jgi:hypothetical protein
MTEREGSKEGRFIARPPSNARAARRTDREFEQTPALSRDPRSIRAHETSHVTGQGNLSRTSVAGTVWRTEADGPGEPGA